MRTKPAEFTDQAIGKPCLSGKPCWALRSVPAPHPGHPCPPGVTRGTSGCPVSCELPHRGLWGTPRGVWQATGTRGQPQAGEGLCAAWARPHITTEPPVWKRPSVHLAVCNAAPSPVSFPSVPGACTLTEVLAHPSQKGRLVVRQPGAMQAGQHPVRCVSSGYGQQRSSTEVGSGGMCDTGHAVSAGWSQSCDKGLHFPRLPPTQCPAGLWPTSPREWRRAELSAPRCRNTPQKNRRTANFYQDMKCCFMVNYLEAPAQRRIKCWQGVHPFTLLPYRPLPTCTTSSPNERCGHRR